MENVQVFQCSEDIMEEAYAWVLAFNSDTPINEEDIARFREWAARSPAHKQAVKEAEAFWCDAEVLSELAVPMKNVALKNGASRNVLMKKKQQQNKGVNSKSFFSVFSKGKGARVFSAKPVVAFASVLLLALSSILVWQIIPPYGSVGNGVYRTAVGEQIELTLRDKSHLLLDTHSEVRIAYEDNTRKIQLLSGKAHFDVAKNPERPFEVYTREGLVRAVGTAFSVYLADSNVEVLVDEGRVDLERIKRIDNQADALQGSQRPASRGNDSAATQPVGEPVGDRVFLSLQRGQAVRFDQKQQVVIQLSEEDLADASSWRNGILIFRREPLNKVVSEMGRYTNTTIEIADPQLSDLVMGGRFQVGKLDALFEVLEIGFGVHVSYVNEHHVQLSMASK